MGSYWNRVLESRVGRRRAIVSAGGLSAAAAFLAACGGGNDNSSGGKTIEDKSGLLTKPADTSKEAKRGGTLQMEVNGEIASLDIHQNYAPNDWIESVASRLIELEGGHLSFPSDAPRPGIASSWEFSPDLTQITMKLRDGVKWHDKPPVNGREITTDDINFSWERYKATGGKRTALVNEVNPSAPLISLTTPDTKTIVAKLAYPIFYGVELMTLYGFFMVPKEAADTKVLDLKGDIFGAGPYILEKYEPSIGATLKRNPTYWEKDKPYMEGQKWSIIPEYAASLAQFKSGALHQFGTRQEDVLSLKKDAPDIGLYQGGVSPDGSRTIFGWQTEAFRDERVRQALSMSWDRDLWIDVFYNTESFTSQGLPVDKRWNTSFVATDAIVSSGFWLDPKDKAKFGDSAKYYEYNVSEAKKLLAAAGFANGLEYDATYAVGSIYTPVHKRFEVLNGFEKEVGLVGKPQNKDYSKEFIPQYRDAQGQFKGITFKIGPSSLTSDPVARMVFDYSASSGVSFYGFGDGGKGDPQVEQNLTKAQRELDADKRKKIVQDLQRYLGQKQYATRWPGGATSFLTAWPAVKNYRAFIGSGDTLINSLNWWLDQSEKPFKT